MDFTKSTNFKGLHLFKKLAGENGFPKYVNAVTPVDSESSYTKLASSSFADVSSREYPINNKPNTWLSALYFLTDAAAEGTKFASEHSRDKTWSAIQLAAEMHGIGEDIDNLATTLISNFQKQAAEAKIVEDTERVYALTVDNNGEEVNYFPINTFEEIKIASDDLFRNMRSIPVSLVKEAAEKIYHELTTKFAGDYAKHPYTMHESLVMLAQPRLIDADKFIKLANERYDYTKDENYKDLATFAEHNKEDYAQLRDAVDTLCELDLQHDLSKYAGTQLDPYTNTASDLTVNDTIKAAAMYVELNDAVVPFAVLKKASVIEGVQALLGMKKSAAFVEALNKSNNALDLARTNVVESLSKEDKNDILRVAVVRG